MGQTNFWTQFVALMKRNYLLKKRNKKHTIQEIISPIYFVLILAIIRLTTSPDERPAIPSFPENEISDQVYQPDSSKLLLVAPNTTAVKTAIGDTLKILAANGSVFVPSVQFYDTGEGAEDAYRDNNTDKGLGIIFEDGTLNNLNYTIRVPYGSVPSMDNLYDGGAYCRGESGLDRCASNLYLYDGFVNLQLALDSALIKLKSMDDFSKPIVKAQMLPKDSWVPDVGWIQILASLYFVMAYAPFVNFMVVALVSEKEKKIKESMRMMGLRDSAFWMAWGMTYLILLTVVNLVVILISFATLLPNSNMFLFFLILTFYSLCIISMSFTITPFFNKAETAGGLASLATMVFSLLYLPVSLTRTVGPDGPVSTIPVGGQWAMCLMPPVALALAIDQAVYLDISHGGMDFSNLTYGQFPLYASLLMLFIDSILFGLLAVYLDNVIPSAYGQRRPPYYFLQSSFWCPKQKNDRKEDIYDTRHEDVSLSLQNDLIEPISEELRHHDKIRIKNIRKVFKSTEEGKTQITAVDGVTLDIYEGQITCLLGHNGAGKTTILNMLTGMTSPSSGGASIYGYDVSDPNQMGEIRSMTGVCPQHNILLDDLTCEEHLEFYGVIKGVDKKDLSAQITQSLQDIDISDKADTRSNKLSGGQKRKLCVAIALIGDPKVIFLDEPTAGMDPYSRRHLWSLLKERRPGRVILLTTHFMDEADILADRKAFISKGKLTCVGSSLFLKNRFGVGYHLSMVVDDPKESGQSIHQFVMTHIPEAELTRIHGKELDITLPLASVDKFAVLFRDLESCHQGASQTKAEEMGIRSYGISMTSLEEVFLKIGIEETVEEADSLDNTLTSPLLGNGKNQTDNTSAYTGSSKQTTGSKNRVSPTQEVTSHSNAKAIHHQDTANTYRDVESAAPATATIPQAQIVDGKQLRNQRFWAFCKIRATVLIRDPASFMFRIVFPVLFIVIGAAVMAFGPRPTRADSTTSLNLNAALYSKINGDAENENPSMLIQTPGPVDANITDFLDMLSAQDIALTNITDSTNLLDIAPHHNGLKPDRVDAINTPVSSDITVLYNDTAFHSFPATVNVISNTLLKMLTSTSDTITTYVQFWPNLKDLSIGYDNSVMSAVILLGLAMSIIPPAFGIAVVREREIKARSLLRISGVTMNMYWSCVFTVDVIQFLSAAILSIAAVLAFQVQSLMYGGAVLALVLLYFLYIPVNMFLSYVLSFAFNKTETAQVVLFNIFFLSSFIPFMAVSMLDMFGVETAADITHYILTLIDPCYALFGGLYYIARVYLIQSIIQGTEEPDIDMSMYFEWDSKIPITLIAPAFHAIWLFFLLRLLEVKKTGGETSEVFCVSGKTTQKDGAQEVNSDIPEDEDEDVQAERDKVKLLQQPGNEEQLPVILVEGLRKEYSKEGESKGCGKKKTKEEKVKVAVRNNTFTVNSGDVFGLLGPNGAGKTTTLNMIIAEEGLSKGKVSVAGYDIKSSLSDAFQAMGYCPQHDALWEVITVREHLMCYAQLTGIAKSEAETVVQYFLDSLHIEEHADKRSKKLSGGTKRKLSYALSMLGEAQVVLLDEPSTGMDPKSKRFMWDTISNTFSGSSRGAILTTHYMEEADALCSRVGIMVNGEMECLGSTQHLKNKYGSGYQLEIKLDQSSHMGAAEADEPMKALDESVKKMFSNPVLTECFGDRAMYSIPQSDVSSLSYVFSSLERGKKDLGIEEYSFSQSTLEQVFLQFAKHQLDEHHEETDGDQQEALKQKKSSMRQTSIPEHTQALSTPL